MSVMLDIRQVIKARYLIEYYTRGFSCFSHKIRMKSDFRFWQQHSVRSSTFTHRHERNRSPVVPTINRQCNIKCVSSSTQPNYNIYKSEFIGSFNILSTIPISFTLQGLLTYSFFLLLHIEYDYFPFSLKSFLIHN